MAVYRTLVALSVKGDRIEPGTEVELTAEEAAIYDPADLALVSDIPTLEPEHQLADTPIEEMTHAQLKARAKELGLSQAGTTADLKERIELSLSSSSETDADGAEEEETETDADGAEEEEITSA